MDIDLMRKIDKTVGVPVCFLLSGAYSLAKPFRKKPNPHPSKILVIQISEMGSAIQAYSSIEVLKQRYPKAKIYYLIFEEMKKSVELLSQIPRAQVLPIRSKSFSALLVDTLKTILFLRNENIDVAIDFELFSRFSSILSFMSASKTRVGFHKFGMEGLYRGSFLTQQVVYNHTASIGSNFVALAKSVNSTQFPLLKERLAKPTVPKIASSPKDTAAILERLKKKNPKISAKSILVILNPNASQLLPLRRWPMEYYAELGKKLLTDDNVFLIITGVAAEKLEAQEMCQKLGARCIDFTGETTLRELIDLYNICHLMISNDSGPPNFASLTHMQTIVLFGPETPLCYAPLGENVHVMFSNFSCSPCVSAYNHRKSYCTDNKCLQAILPNEVFLFAKRLLGEPK